ncbi:KEOPS complex subunit Cgi121 [Halodesulfurarchaeum sp.]|uniref:KEOPS complex subunit Cgi121 n=1 Tax=Halodesulfurarchaeum sp. TaxID=1980530 RepID=UPI001BC484FE|nr:KEOPS complex component [Halodesulfurarchaeum sp.]
MKTVTGRVWIGDGDSEEHRAETRGAFDSLESVLSTFRTISEEYDVLLQAFDARYIAGEAHLQAALDHAKRSMRRGENVADELAVEVLLYAAGRRQIDEAMTLGLRTGEQSVIVLLEGDRADAAVGAVREQLDPGPVEPEESALTEYFEITPAERAATTGDLGDLVRERVALLDVEK